MYAVIGAHPDDAELGAGGLLALKGGIIISMTDGHNGTRDPDLAAEEMAAAAEVLGCKHVILPNKQISSISQGMVSDLDEILGYNRVSCVLTHANYDTNQEHVLTSQAALAASRRLGRVLFFEPIPPAGRVHFNAQMYLDISEGAGEKYAAIGQYKSQILREGRDLLQTRMHLDRWRGMELQGSGYAECYEVVRWTL